MSSSDWAKQIAEWEAKGKSEGQRPTPSTTSPPASAENAARVAAPAPPKDPKDRPAPADIDYASLTPDATYVTEGRSVEGQTRVYHPKAPAMSWCDQMQAMAAPDDGSTQGLADFANAYVNR